MRHIKLKVKMYSRITATEFSVEESLQRERSAYIHLGGRVDEILSTSKPQKNIQCNLSRLPFQLSWYPINISLGCTPGL